MIANAQNSSNNIIPPPFPSISLKVYSGSGIFTPHFSIVVTAFKNSALSSLLSPLSSIYVNMTQYSKYYLRYNKKYLNSLNWIKSSPCVDFDLTQSLAAMNALIIGFLQSNISGSTRMSITPLSTSARDRNPFPLVSNYINSDFLRSLSS